MFDADGKVVYEPKAAEPAVKAPFLVKVSMKAYYGSKLADKIHHGVEGVQHLDHKVLAQVLEETEPEILQML